MTLQRWGLRPKYRNLLLGLIFISPWLIGFIVFTIYPLISSLYYSLHRYDLLRPPVFLGLDNYITFFTDKSHTPVVVYNTLYYVVLSAPLGVVSAFLLAGLLNTQIKGRSVFRAIFFFPAIVPAIVTAQIWRFLLNVQYGAVNGALQGLGLSTIPFLSNPDLSKPSLILIHMWAQGNAMLIFLATLQDVPRSLYEAATVDGANGWHKFRYITIPMCSPVILFNLIMAFIGGFQNFTLPWLISGGTGGPNQSTEFYSIHLYRRAFQNLHMGYASAMAWILFVVIVAFTVILFRSSGRWVYYGGAAE
ncbi:MAG: sugar ABC transporter permease [Anaerolineae bacterium]|nr:sugar ABC transporter permease [Anaerolineae bacterium]